MPVHYDPRMTFDEGLELAKCVPEVKALVEALHMMAYKRMWRTGYPNEEGKQWHATYTEAELGRALQALAPFQEAPDAHMPILR